VCELFACACVSVKDRECYGRGERKRLCGCVRECEVCVSEGVRVRVCVCVCKRKRKRTREQERERGRDRGRNGRGMGGGERETDCVCVHAWVGVSARIYDSNSLGDRAREGRGSECRHAGTGEEISACIHVANSHGDSPENGRRSDRRHSANFLWERVASCMSVGASIIVAYIRVGGVLRGSSDVSKGAQLDMFGTMKGGLTRGVACRK